MKTNEYVTKEDVIELLTTENCDKYCHAQMCKFCEYMIDDIEVMKAADVQPVKHGRWIDIYEYCEKNGYIPSGMGIYYWCSECGESEPKTSDYCPNCGARMDLKGGHAE